MTCWETMYDAAGQSALAAIQIGVPLRVIVMDLAKEGEEPAAALFREPGNRRDRGRDPRPMKRGCLSVPDIFDEVERPEKCLIRYLDYDGFQVEEWAEDLYAVCIQHEMDHLEGTLFIDYLSRLKRQRAVDKVKKAKLRALRENVA
jgi:peptide deformylase